MLPDFTIAGGVWLVLARAAAVAALLCLFGGLVFGWVVRPLATATVTAPARDLDGRLLRLNRAAVAAGLLAMLAWLVLQAADMAGATDAGQALAGLPVVAARTAFGHLVLLQLAALVATGAVLGGKPGPARQRVALALATLLLLLQAGHSHSASMYGRPSWLLAADVVHLLAAGAWLGGLLPLLVTVRQAPPRAAAMAARRFSPLGKLCIVALAVTSAFQGWVLSGSFAAIVGTAYGWMLLVKLALFGVLFGFACANRYRLAPGLLGGEPERARRSLGRSIAVQTGFGLAIVVAAAMLSSLTPGMHLQPIWPFADRFSLETVSEDVDFRNEALGAALALGLAIVLLAVAVLLRGGWRRWPRCGWARWAAAGAAVVIAWFAIPHLDLLFVPAYPTSYYHSPTQFAATSIAEGATLFPLNCAVCHGAQGRGDGPLAASLPIPPANLTAGHLWMHSDGELYWWLAHGIPAPNGSPAMPGFAGTLSDDQRWALIDYVRAHNAGLVVARTGDWTPALRAPEIDADCTDGVRTLADLRGGFVRVLIGVEAATAAPGVTTILAAAHAAPGPGLCIARDPAVAAAYAIVTGRAAAAPTQILIDAAGWLRAAEPTAPNGAPKAALTAELQRFASHPVSTAPQPMDMDMGMGSGMGSGMNMGEPQGTGHAKPLR